MLMQFKLLFSCVQFQWQPSPFAHSCIANHRLWHEANRGKAILQRGKCGTLTAAGRVEHIWPCSLGVHCPNPSARLHGEERGVLTPPQLLCWNVSPLKHPSPLTFSSCPHLQHQCLHQPVPFTRQMKASSKKTGQTGFKGNMKVLQMMQDFMKSIMWF